MRSSCAVAQTSLVSDAMDRRTDEATLAAAVRSSVEQNSSTSTVPARFREASSNAIARESRAFCPSESLPAGVTSGWASARPQALSRRSLCSMGARSLSITGVRVRGEMRFAITHEFVERASSARIMDLPDPLGPMMSAIVPGLRRPMSSCAQSLALVRSSSSRSAAAWSCRGSPNRALTSVTPVRSLIGGRTCRTLLRRARRWLLCVCVRRTG